MLQFFGLISNLFRDIFAVLYDCVLPVGTGFGVVTLAGVLMSCVIIGFAVNVFWKGAKA